MNVLLSIKPQFAQKILSLEKRYEFRRTPFRDPTLVDTIFMYASSPMKKIVGQFSINGVVEQRPEQLWEQFGPKSGVDDRGTFMEYFEGKETGYAMKIDEVCEFDEPVDPRDYVAQFHPPLSFRYLDGEFKFLHSVDGPNQMTGVAGD